MTDFDNGEQWVEAGGAPAGTPAGAKAPADLLDQVALDAALHALHGDVEAESRLADAIRQTLMRDNRAKAAISSSSATPVRRANFIRANRARAAVSKRSMRQRYAFAGALVMAAMLVVGIGTLWLMSPLDPRPRLDAGSIAGLAIGDRLPVGGDLVCATEVRVLWSDGSTARCGTASRIRIASTGMLELLRGSLDCAVEPRPPGRDFTVTSPQAQIAVKGTRFTVEVADDGTTVSVASGRVVTTAAVGRLDLTQGMRVLFATDSHAWSVVRRFLPTDPDLPQLLLWGTCGTWHGQPAILPGDMPKEDGSAFREIAIGHNHEDEVMPFIARGRLIAEISLDRPSALHLWTRNQRANQSLVTPVDILADGQLHRISIDLATLRDESGRAVSTDSGWSKVILLVDDPAARFVVTRMTFLKEVPLSR
ncbi:MAG: FecR domain-containing protein [Planctomycetes bacterium]|nr:FecR domain-containing protein [Planctomycetota bacterium]